MARGAGMSRGCATCRQRKIKCDERQPECDRCLKSGRKCPGSVVGAVFLAFNGQDSMKSKRIEHDNQGIRQLRQPERKPRRVNQQASSISAITNDIHTPDPSDLLERQLRASFISFFNRSGSNMTQIQSWLECSFFGAEDMSLPGWKEAVLAASLALYGANEQNQGAIAASYKWYHRALCLQRRNMRIYAENSNTQVSEMNVSMAVILAYSEVILPTHPRAFSQHIKAAAALLQILGPEACMQGTLHQLFLTIRLYMIYESFDEWTTSTFASSQWIRGPFQAREKRLSDLVVDLLLQIPGDMASPLVAVGLLKGLWCQLVQSNPSLTSSPRYTFLKTVPESQDLWNCVPDKFTHVSSETAIALALYSFGWVVSLSLLNQCGDDAAENVEIINGHCETILDAAAFVSAIQDGCSYIRMTPPLRAVSYYSSNPNQRERSIGFMQLWGKSIKLLQMSATSVGQSWPCYNLDYYM